MNGNRKYDDQELKTADLKAFLEYGGEFLNIVRPQIKSALVDLENTAEQLQNKTRRLDADLSSINEKYQKLLNIPANSRDLEKLSRLLENNTERISEDLPRIINQYQKLLDLQAKAQEKESKLRNAAPQAPARVSEKLVNEVQEKAQS